MQKLLLLASNPRKDLNLEREISDLNNSIQKFQTLEVVLGLGVRPQELQNLLAEHSPQFVHFCGHGAGEQGLVFQNDDGQETLMSTALLARIFETFSSDVSCTVLNACNSSCQAEVIVEHIDYVVGMGQPILDRAAHFFSLGFYKGLATGASIEKSYKMGCNAIQTWWETLPSSGYSRQHRDLKEARDIGRSDLSLELEPVPEQDKPILFKKCDRQLPQPAEQPPLPASYHRQPQLQLQLPTPEPDDFTTFIQKEVELKQYKDAARDVYDYFGQYSAQNKAVIKKSGYRQQKIFLSKVKRLWIEGFLMPSLDGIAAVRLGLREEAGVIASTTPESTAPNATTQRIESLSVELDHSFEQLRETQIYSEMGRGKTLLILGDPGAGKTIALLQLAQRLIEQSEQQLNAPMPAVFNLSSWAEHRKPLTEWLLDELLEKYQVPQTLGKQWLKQQQLILLLDGLDEVEQQYRNDCVRAVNEFMTVFPQVEMTVCSRIKDYEALTERLNLSCALCLQPFSSEQVHHFLQGFGESLAGLKTLIEQDAVIAQFARTPLILNLMSVAYKDWSADVLSSQLKTAPSLCEHLFESYTERILLEGTVSEYSKNDTLRWLGYLASEMVREKQTIFLIERMQPSWLRSQVEKRGYRLASFCVLEIRKAKQEIRPVEKLTWSWQHAKSRALPDFCEGIASGLGFWMAAGLLSGVVVILICLMLEKYNGVEISVHFLFWGSLFGMLAALSNGLSLALLSGLSSTDIEQRMVPNQGIRNSFRSAVLSGLIILCVFAGAGAIIHWLAPGETPNLSLKILMSVIACIVLALWRIVLKYGGAACLKHFVLRWMLYRAGRVPWNYAKFLNFASEKQILKKVGGSYVFCHRMLLEHLASKSVVEELR